MKHSQLTHTHTFKHLNIERKPACISRLRGFSAHVLFDAVGSPIPKVLLLNPFQSLWFGVGGLSVRGVKISSSSTTAHLQPSG